MKGPSVAGVTKARVREVVYFKKLKAIKQLVLLLDLTEGDVDLDGDIPADLKVKYPEANLRSVLGHKTYAREADIRTEEGQTWKYMGTDSKSGDWPLSLERRLVIGRFVKFFREIYQLTNHNATTFCVPIIPRHCLPLDLCKSLSFMSPNLRLRTERREIH